MIVRLISLIFLIFPVICNAQIDIKMHYFRQNEELTIIIINSQCDSALLANHPLPDNGVIKINLLNREKVALGGTSYPILDKNKRMVGGVLIPPKDTLVCRYNLSMDISKIEKMNNDEPKYLQIFMGFNYFFNHVRYRYKDVQILKI